jgi:hypothetical protein
LPEGNKIRAQPERHRRRGRAACDRAFDNLTLFSLAIRVPRRPRFVLSGDNANFPRFSHYSDELRALQMSKTHSLLKGQAMLHDKCAGISNLKKSLAAGSID